MIYLVKNSKMLCNWSAAKQVVAVRKKYDFCTIDLAFKVRISD